MLCPLALMLGRGLDIVIGTGSRMLGRRIDILIGTVRRMVDRGLGIVIAEHQTSIPAYNIP